MTSKLRTGYVIIYPGCLVTRATKMQTEVVHITTRAELSAMSKGLLKNKPLSAWW